MGLKEDIMEYKQQKEEKKVKEKMKAAKSEQRRSANLRTYMDKVM